MIHNNLETKALYIGDKEIKAIYKNDILLWSNNSNLACFSGGFWDDTKPWIDTEIWAD